MIDLMSMLEGLLETARRNAAQSYTNKSMSEYLKDHPKVGHCIALAKAEWKAVSCVREETSSTITVTWQKADKPDINIKLSFLEQRLWFAYLERKEK